MPTDTRRYTVIMEVFSTVTSPVFSGLVIVLGLDDIIHLYRQFMLLNTLSKTLLFRLPPRARSDSKWVNQ